MSAHSYAFRRVAVAVAGAVLSTTALAGSAGAATPTPSLPGYAKPPLQGPRLTGPASETGVTRPGPVQAEPEVAADG